MALDLATTTGWCRGVVGTTPESGAVRVRQPNEDLCYAPYNLETFLKDKNLFGKPELIVYEAPINLHAEFKDADGNRIPQSEESLKMPIKLEQAIERYCLPRGIRFERVSPATARKHFIGKSNFGSKEATKNAVLNRCKLLGYIPKDAVPTYKNGIWDRADACCVWDWAAATKGRSIPKTLVMFNEQVRV